MVMLVLVLVLMFLRRNLNIVLCVFCCMHLQDVSGCLLMMAHDVRFVPVVRFARIRLITGYCVLDTNSCFTGYCTDAFEGIK